MTEDTSNKSLIEKEARPLRDSQGKFLKGSSGNLAGKPRGTISRLARLREDFIRTYEEMGGVQGLTAWAKKNPEQFYSFIYRMIPKADAFLEIHTASLSYEERLRTVLGQEGERGGVEGDIGEVDLDEGEEGESNEDEELG